MIDPRFYLLHGPVSVGDLADGAEVRGERDTHITGVAPVDAAGPNDLAYFDGKGLPPENRAGALIVRSQIADRLDAAACLIVARDPRAHFAGIAAKIATERGFGEDAPLIARDAELEEGVRIAPGVVIGSGARIGSGAVIGANAVIGPGVSVGRGSRIGALASVQCALIGDHVTVLVGALIGQSGFGVAVGPNGPIDLPHFGRAILQDGVSVGAGSTVDRGLFGDTVLAEGAKIDNLCQIAHNCVIGRGAVIAAFGGISGSTVVGDGAMMGGRVGIADHRKIGRGAQLAAGSAVMHDVPDGETWAGYPAKPIRQWLRETAWLNRAIGKRDGSDS